MLNVIAQQSPPSSEEPAAREAAKGRRRGATAMEYLFVISLILVVLITTIGYFGESVEGTTHNAGKAIEKAVNANQLNVTPVP
jgi:Flp pilus assembly pilin Flp